MITKEEIQKGQAKQTLKSLVIGPTGSGKTYFGLTFPKVAYLGTEPNGLDTAKANPHLLENLTWAEEFIPSPTEDIKETFKRLDEAIVKAHQDKEVETLFLDNISFLSENRWEYINKYESARSQKTGELDTRGMYGTLGRWMYQFTLKSLLSFKGNVVVSCHEMLEGDEAMERKLDKTTPIVANILGGFREKVGGMFSAVLFLSSKRMADKYQFTARCMKGGQRFAKNRYGLPEIVPSVSYQVIMDTIKKVNQEGSK